MTSADWQAPSPEGPIRATVRLPGSKSQTSRALIIGTIAQNPLQIRGALAARDTLLAARAMRQLGARFQVDSAAGTPGSAPASAPVAANAAGSPVDPVADRTSDTLDKGVFTIVPPGRLRGGSHIDCGLAGTVMRFGPALAAFANGVTHFDGDVGARKRPLAPLLNALETMGAQVIYAGVPGYLPFSIRGISGEGVGAENLEDTVVVDTTTSSQYLSAMLLASPLFPKSVTLRAEGKLPSLPYVQMSLQMLDDQGVHVEQVDDQSWRTDPTRPLGNPIAIEPDLSNAGPFLAAALICGGQVRIPGWPDQTDQVGKYWEKLLPLFGASVEVDEDGLTVSAPANHAWTGIEQDLAACGELAPTLAALCALAKTPSTLRGIAHLRGHETDRLQAIATEVERLGGNVEILSDGLRIVPVPRDQLRPARIQTYEDHRMATFGALLGLAIPGCTVENIATTAKTLPDFPGRWQAMLRGEASPPVDSLAVALTDRGDDLG